MTKIQNSKQYDLEERTLEFSKRIIRLAKALPKNTINLRLIDQLIRSGTSMGANYVKVVLDFENLNFEFIWNL